VYEKRAVAVVAIEVERNYVLYDLCIEVYEIGFHRTVFCLKYELKLKKQLSI
jgi:hypothetical protein